MSFLVNSHSLGAGKIRDQSRSGASQLNFHNLQEEHLSGLQSVTRTANSEFDLLVLEIELVFGECSIMFLLQLHVHF